MAQDDDRDAELCVDCGGELEQYEVEDFDTVHGLHCKGCYAIHWSTAQAALDSSDFVPLVPEWD